MSSKRDAYEKMNVSTLLKAPAFGSATVPEFVCDPLTRTRMPVSLDQLRPFHLNPRSSRNPKYDDIKESIRSRGLDSPPPITRRPGEANYVIANGGNTRLQILNELWEETRDRRFYDIECDFVPWVSDAHALAGHMIENDKRGDMTFIDRALAIQTLQALWEETDGVSLSQRDMVRRLADAGYRVSPGHIAKYQFTLEHLYPHIPQTLHSGMGKPQIEKLARLRSACFKVWQQLDTHRDSDEFALAFGIALTDCDQYNDADAWDYLVVEDDVLRQLARSFEVPFSKLQLAVEQALHERVSNNDDDEDIASPAAPLTGALITSAQNYTPNTPPPYAHHDNSDLTLGSHGNTSGAGREHAPPVPSNADGRQGLAVVPGAQDTPQIPVTVTGLPANLESLVNYNAHVARQSMQLWDRLLDANPVLYREQLYDGVTSLAQLGQLPPEYLIESPESEFGFELLAPGPEISQQWSERTRAIWWLLADIQNADMPPEQRIALLTRVPPANPLWVLLHDFRAELPDVDPALMVGTVIDVLLSSRQWRQRTAHYDA